MPPNTSAAASSNVRLRGIGATLLSDATTYSAWDPMRVPNTLSPGTKRATDGPTAATSPANSHPRVVCAGRGCRKQAASSDQILAAPERSADANHPH